MSEKVYIEIDASPWIDADGITTSVWIGDACEPCYENKQSLEELVNQELEAHTVFGKLTDKHGYDNVGEAEKFVVALEEAAVYARRRFEELKDNG